MKLDNSKKSALGIIMILLGLYFVVYPIKDYETVTQIVSLIIIGVGIYWGSKYG